MQAPVGDDPRLLADLPDDGGLAGGSEEHTVLGPQVHEAVAEPVPDRVDADVGEDPLGGCARGDAEGVVEAVAARVDAENDNDLSESEED